MIAQVLLAFTIVAEERITEIDDETTPNDAETTVQAFVTDVTTESPKVEKTNMVWIVFWIIVCVALLVIILSLLAYWIISNKQKMAAALPATHRRPQAKVSPRTPKNIDVEDDQESTASFSTEITATDV